MVRVMDIEVVEYWVVLMVAKKVGKRDVLLVVSWVVKMVSR